MSIVSSHLPAVDWIEAVCIGCNAAIETPAGSPAPRCTSCQRSDAEAEASKLLADARDLRDGKGIYAGLTAEERREQLQSLVLSTAKDDWKPAEKPIDEAFRDFVACLSDSSVDLLADLIARKIAERRKPGRTLVQICMDDLSTHALHAIVATSDQPIILNAAHAALEVRRRAPLGYAATLPIYSKPVGADPTPAERYEIEGRLESDVPPECLADEHPHAADGDFFNADFAA